jgi:dienelactone hydrolase
MLVDLVQTTTRDGVRLDGVYHAPPGGSGANWGVDGFVCVHGTGSNFYGSTLFEAVAERLLSLGVGVLRVNTRGHDLMNTAATPRGGMRLGAAYEALDDCRLDLQAWIDWLKQRAGARVGLIGHSSGAVKCLYAQAHDPDPAVTRLIAVSPPRLAYSVFAQSDQARLFLDMYERAKLLVDAGEGAILLETVVPLPLVITAAGFVEKYGPDERYHYEQFLGRVRCSTLLTLGAREVTGHMAFKGAAEVVARASPAVRIETIADADHFYTGVRERLLDCVEHWLRETGAN